MKDEIVLATKEMMASIEKRFLQLEADKKDLQSRLTNLRAYLQGEHSMGGGFLERIEEGTR